jgi:hypothetical protein
MNTVPMDYVFWALPYNWSRPDLLRDSASAIEVFRLISGLVPLGSFNIYNNVKNNEFFLSENFSDNTILTVVTRPAMDDDPMIERRIIPRSYSAAEEKMFQTFRPFFKNLSRSFVQLQPEFARNLSAKYKDFGAIRYRVNTKGNKSGCIFSLHRNIHIIRKMDDNYDKTMGYVILMQPREDMPRILAVFTVSGVNTFFLIKLLKFKIWAELNLDLLHDNRFAMILFSARFDIQDLYQDKLTGANDYEIVLNLDVSHMLK